MRSTSTTETSSRYVSRLLPGAFVLAAGVLALGPAALAQSTSASIPTWARGQVISSVPVRAGDKPIALTFDDGPDGNTDGFLAKLRELNVPATFFVVGEHVAASPAATRRIRDAGHAIGNHTWSHEQAPTDPAWQVTQTDAAIQSALGFTPALFRPPFGNMTNGVATQAMQRGKGCFLWSVDPRDWAFPGTASIVETVVNGATPGGIVLLHDAGGDRSQTLAALPEIVTTLRARGFRFVTIPQLLDLRDPNVPLGGGGTTPPPPASTVGDGLAATYFNNADFTGTSVSRVDSRVSFSWGKNRAPALGIATDTFSVRWTGQIVAPKNETYTFALRADDGVRMWIDNKLVIDRWRTGSAESRAIVPMTAGKRTDIKIEYFDGTGQADIDLAWSSASTVRATVPQSALFSRALAAPPSISMASPQPHFSYASLAGASGSAVDGGNGIVSTNGLLFRFRDSSYWNGSAWGVDVVESAASTSATPGGAAWSFGFPALAEGKYATQAVARDRAGASTFTEWVPFWIDTTPPQVAVSAPTAGGIYVTAVTAGGTASDAGPGIASIRATLARETGEFWNGTGWVSTPFELQASVSNAGNSDNPTAVNWALPLPSLDAGTYVLQGVARDYIGNIGRSTEVRFVVSPKSLAALRVVPAPAVSLPPVLSRATVVGTEVRLRFTPPLHPRSTARPHWAVEVNGRAVRVEKISFDRATNTITLRVPTLGPGARVKVQWRSLRAVTGRVLRDGAWTGAAS
jgi:peptidoglycan/xylan/chitin deacetylase (PgdA/CDA1 family)